MDKNRRQSIMKRQQGSSKIFDACYATDEPTYFTNGGMNAVTNISQQSLSSKSSSNDEASLSSDEDTSPDVTNTIPNVVFTPTTPQLGEKVAGKKRFWL